MKGEEKLEYMRWQGSSVESDTGMLAYDFFFTFFFFFVFWAIMPGDSFFLFLFLHVCSTANATFLITNLFCYERNETLALRRAIFTHSPWQKKSSKKMTMLFWWKKIGKYLCVFCVEALAPRNKKKMKWRGEEREREETSKKRGEWRQVWMISLHYSAITTKSKMATPRMKKSFWNANLVKMRKKAVHHKL